MEIQKVFSDQYGEERLYSVLMSEEEMILFSELQREFTSIRKMKKVMKSSEPFLDKAIKQISEPGSNIPYSPHKVNLSMGMSRLIKGKMLAQKSPKSHEVAVKTYKKLKPKVHEAFVEGSDVILKPEGMKYLRKKGINPIGI